MNSSKFFAVAALATVAAFASVGAQADEADSSQYAVQFDGARTRAEVKAEAATVAATRSTEPNGSRVLSVQSNNDRASVRAQAAEAVRTGHISAGEASYL